MTFSRTTIWLALTIEIVLIIILSIIAIYNRPKLTTAENQGNFQALDFKAERQKLDQLYQQGSITRQFFIAQKQMIAEQENRQ